MKRTKNLFLAVAVAASSLVLAGNANALLINITMEDATTKVDDISKNANPTGDNGNDPANHLAWLTDFVVPWYNGWAPATLPDPTGLNLVVSEGNVAGNGVPTFDLTGILYITYHYGVGPGGDQASGGGLVAIYNDGMTGDFTPPADGLGPNGYGGLSTVYAWGTREVPEGGMTLVMLGLGMGGVVLAQRRLNRRQPVLAQ